MNFHLKDYKSYLLWLLIAFVIANFTFKPIILLFVIYLGYRYIYSKNNVVYFSVFFALLANVGGLFGSNFDGIISLGIIEFRLVSIFVFINYLKFIIRRPPKQFFHFEKPVVVYLIYVVLLVLMGFLIGVESVGKSGLRHFYQIANLLILMPIFLLLPKALVGKNFIDKLSGYIFISVFINLLGQLFMMVQGIPLSQFVNPDPNYGILAGETNYMDEEFRALLGGWVSIFALFFAMFHKVKKKLLYGNIYLNTIIFLSFISIFITGTRGWILATILFAFLSIVYFSAKSKINIGGVVIVGILIFILSYSFIPMIKTQIDHSYNRFSTVFYILDGDLSAGGTSIRHIRGKEVMKVFYDSPIVGLGFSSKTLNNTDQHVGNQMILASGGVIGFLIILVLLLNLSLKTWNFKYPLYIKKEYGGELKLIPFFLMALFLIHSTSTALFGYSVYVKAYGNMLWIVIVISLINKILNEYYEESVN